MSTERKSTDFKIEVTDQAPAEQLPAKLGRRLWGPMWLMAIMAFPVAFIIGAVRANAIATGASEQTISSLQHVATGIMFIGFASVFAAISFAIAHILGVFRKGGGEVQEVVGAKVHTLKVQGTAKVFILGMAMAMMAILIASIIHFVWGAWVAAGAVSVTAAEEAFIVLEAVRRIGIALYLVSITLGLATITKVLRFQAIRVRELAEVSSS